MAPRRGAQFVVDCGATPRGSTPAELQQTISADKERYGKVIKAGGIHLD